ncbi:MAG: phospholipase D-like domain-containing protein [Atribacterota bacterium]
MKTLKVLLLKIFIVSVTLSKLLGYSAEVENISGQKYYPAVREVIQKANDSIHMSMFVVSLYPDREDSAVYDLCESLVEAKKRGVDVKVILDQNINFFDDEYKNKVEGKNFKAFEYLKKNGIDVNFDDRYTYTHSKALVVDKEIVVIGSTNWSQSALTINNEHSVLIKSPELAESILKSFEEIELASPRISRPIDKKKALAISKVFLESKNLAGRMITKHDERALDLYLLLLYNAKEENNIDFDFDEYAKDLGIEDMKKKAYRRQIIKSLRKLKNRYNIIDVEFHHGKNAKVKLLDINNKDRYYKYPEEDYFLLPEKYFKYGWNRSLSLLVKYCYLINRYMVQENKNRFWSMSRKNLAEKFNLHFKTISQGMNELRKLNIIDIEYLGVGEDYETRRPAIYELLGLYSPEEHKRKLKELEEKYGEEKFKDARDFAKVVYRQNDIKAIEEVIKLTEKYGKEQVEEAKEILSKKAVDNPKRTFRYAVGIIRNVRK